MSRMLISVAALVALTTAAQAQAPAAPGAVTPPEASTPAEAAASVGKPADTAPAADKPAASTAASQPNEAKSSDKPAAGTTPPSSQASATDAGKGASDNATATEQTYKMKQGGMYKPPEPRPASPAQDLNVYGRT